MAENSKIEWTDHTFNPWIGCTKVSPGCTNCYAAVDTFARRERAHGRELWGPRAERHRTAEAYWKQPITWNKHQWWQCDICGRRWREDYWQDVCLHNAVDNYDHASRVRQRVFCSSLADVFEAHEGLDAWRADLFALIEATPNLDWLLLTKRPENVSNMVPYGWMQKFPQNIWLGTSVESQKYADERLPHLVNIPAKVRFLSCEPLLGRINLKDWTEPCSYYCDHGDMYPEGHRPEKSKIDWVICGGESGPHARPMHPDWARSLRDQCQAAGVPFFFKQWGEYIFDLQLVQDNTFDKLPNNKGDIHTNGGFTYFKVGKKKAGRLLDGREWNEVP